MLKKMTILITLFSIAIACKKEGVYVEKKQDCRKCGWVITKLHEGVQRADSIPLWFLINENLIDSNICHVVKAGDFYKGDTIKSVYCY